MASRQAIPGKKSKRQLVTQLLSAMAPPTGGGLSKSARRRARRANADTVTAVPAAVATSYVSRPPSFYSKGNSVVVVHRELLGSVTSSVAYGNTVSKVIQPGLKTTFPWLANVAINYEEYRFHKLRFMYEPSCSSATAGQVFLAVDFDVTDPAPGTEMDISSYAGAVASQPYGRMFMDCPPNRLMGLSSVKYIRPYALAANEDQKTYDCGNLYVGVVGCLDGVTHLGTVWSEYTVELITPGRPTDLPYESSAKITSGGAVSRPNWMGDSPTIVQGAANPVNVSTTNGTIYFSEPGNYKLDSAFVGTTFTDGAPSTAGSTVSSFARIAGIVNAAATNLWEVWEVIVSEPGQKLIVDFTAVAATLTSSAIRLSSYKNSLS